MFATRGVRPGDDGDQRRHQQCRTGYRQRIVVKHLDALLLNASSQRGIHVSGGNQRGGGRAGCWASDRGRRRQEAATLRDQHGLRAVTYVERFEHRADVRLDRALRRRRARARSPYWRSRAEHADDFELPQREAVGVRRCVRSASPGTNTSPASTFLDRDDHLVGGERLRNEARRHRPRLRGTRRPAARRRRS